MYDTIIINAKIYSMENDSDIYSAMTIDNGIIRELFSDNPSKPELLAKSVINASGKTILPGLIDSHVHFIFSAISHEVGLPISEVINGKLLPTNLDSVKNKVLKFVKDKPADQSLVFTNTIVPSLEENRLPNKDEIDEWLPNRIAVFFTIDGHACSVSTKTLEALGIDPTDHDGMLTEDVSDFTPEKLYDIILDKVNLKMLLNGIISLLNEATSYGISGIHCLDGFKSKVIDDSGLKFLFKFGGKFKQHISVYPQIRDVDFVDPYTDKMDSQRVGGCFNWVMDGSTGAHTAAFYKDYIDDKNNKGTVLFPADELLRSVNKAYNRGYQITSHAIGTRAIDELLNAYEKVMKNNYDAENKYRLRIDHFEFPSETALDRAITDLKLIIVPQPGFNWINYNFKSMRSYEKTLDPEIISRQNPLRDIIDRGGIICGSSDSPIQSMDPFLQIHGMVNFPIKKQRLSVYEAFRAYTYNGAYATFAEDIRGTLKIGKLADFIILDNNPFEISTDKLMNLRVKALYIRGKLVNRIDKKPWRFMFKLLFTKNNKV